MKKLLIIIVSLFMISYVSYGQIDTNKFNKGGKFRKAYKEKLMQVLNIDSKTADDFISLSNQYRQTVGSYMKELKETNKTLENPGTGIDVKTTLDKLLDLEYKIVSARKGYFSDALKILSPEQFAKALQFNKKFRQSIRDEIKKNRW
ncbi:MAG: hypothetical protein ACP5P3_07405 [Ignavibacteria bacterium]